MKKNIAKIVVLLLIAITSFLEAIFGLYIGRIIDAISNQNNFLFYQRLIITLGIIICILVFKILSKAGIYRDSCNKARALKTKLFNRELSKKRSEGYDVANFSSKIDLLYDDYFLNKWLIVENITLFIFSALAIISINWIMLIVAISVSFLPMFVPSLLQKYVQKAAKMYSDETTQYIDFLNDSLLGRLEIVKYRVVDHFLNKHNIANDYLESKRFKNRTANNNANSLTGVVGNATFLIVFLAGGLLSMRGLMTIGGVVGVVQLMNNVVRPIVGIAQYKNEMNSCKPIINELSCDTSDKSGNKTFGKQEHDVKSRRERLNNKKTNELAVENISYKYPGMSEPIIQDFSYTFEQGKKYLITGESGVGKSTLAKILTGELTLEKGQVCFNGKDIKKLSLVERIRRINYVDQQSYVFKDTIRNNISMYRNISDDLIKKIMTCLKLNEIEMDKIINDASGISGGQKSRISLARATVELPKILIVDEPTASLDYNSSVAVLKYLCELPITVIVISHHIKEHLEELFDKKLTIGEVYD